MQSSSVTSNSVDSVEMLENVVTPVSVKFAPDASFVATRVTGVRDERQDPTADGRAAERRGRRGERRRRDDGGHAIDGGHA